ncbi:MAG: SDR family NAD(P)-dependent oxidoreductase [Pirellulales bacterium]
MSEVASVHFPRLRRRRLAGLRVLVTGGSSGVGRALALAVANRGGRVLAAARRADRLASLIEEAPAGSIIVEAGDVTNADFRARLCTVAAERLGGLDICASVAGSGAVGPFRDASADTLNRIMAVNFLAPADLVHRCLPLLEAAADPAIVLVGSILGHHPLPWHGEYCAAKAALRSLATTLRIELAPRSIDVLLASLGPTESEFWEGLVAGRRASWSRGRQMPAARAAAAIVAGLECRRREILPGWRAKGYALAARFAPGIIDAITARRLPAEPPGHQPPAS